MQSFNIGWVASCTHWGIVGRMESVSKCNHCHVRRAKNYSGIRTFLKISFYNVINEMKPYFNLDNIMNKAVGYTNVLV